MREVSSHSNLNANPNPNPNPSPNPTPTPTPTPNPYQVRGCVGAGLLSMRLAGRGKLSLEQVVHVGVTTAVVLALVPCAAFLTYNEGLFDWFSLYSIALAS